MNLLDKIKNNTVFLNKYKTDSEAVIISCFFNPQRSKYRTSAFNKFYNDIKHLNHLIIEGVISTSTPELPETENIKHVKTESHLWHKEGLLNYAISILPKKYKYVFWVDADVIFDNKDWLVDGAEKLRSGFRFIQPFEYCVHLKQDTYDISNNDLWAIDEYLPNTYSSNVWRSFSATFEQYKTSLANSLEYNTYGHVGFAWGATREVLDKVGLFDRALIGGADHVMALGAAGKLNHPSMLKSFTENLEEIDEYQVDLYNMVQGKVGAVPGVLKHIWHGDIEKRQYLKRIQDFTPRTKTITKKDEFGLYVAENNEDSFVTTYMNHRDSIDDDVLPVEEKTEHTFDGFGGGSGGGSGASGDYGTEDRTSNDSNLGNFS